MCPLLGVSAQGGFTVNQRAYRVYSLHVAGERQTNSWDLAETAAFKRKGSEKPIISWLTSGRLYPLDAQRNPRLLKECQQESALPKMMPTDAASLDSTMRKAWSISAYVGIRSTQLICAEGFALQCFSLVPVPSHPISNPYNHVGVRSKRGCNYSAFWE